MNLNWWIQKLWWLWCYFGSGKPRDFFKSGDFGESGESAYPGNSVDFDEDFDYSVESGLSGYYGKYCDIGESGNSSANFGSRECGVSGNLIGSGLPGESVDFGKVSDDSVEFGDPDKYSKYCNSA